MPDLASPAQARCLVSNTTPLIALTAATGGLDVLRHLYQRVVVPLEVADEVRAGGPKAFGVDVFNAAAHWLEIQPGPVVLQPFVDDRKPNSGGTDQAWLCDMRADGWSLDDKRQPLLALNPAKALGEADQAKNNLPDVLVRWRLKEGAERQRSRTEQSFCVPQAEIAGNGFDLSINRYKEVVHDAVEHVPPKEILARLAALEAEIQAGMESLEGMLH